MAVQFGSPSIVKELSFKEDAKSKLIAGIDKLAEAVGSTLGASGRTVVLEDDYGNPHVTKDGVTVANYVNLDTWALVKSLVDNPLPASEFCFKFKAFCKPVILPIPRASKLDLFVSM